MTLARGATLASISALALQIAAQSDAAAHEQATLEITISSIADGMTLKLPDGGVTGAPIAPSAYAVVKDGATIFAARQPAGDSGLESLAEDGNSDAFIQHLKAMPGVIEADMFIRGQPFEVTVHPGERLAFAAMFVQSNDTYVAAEPQGMPLFDMNTRPITADVTDAVQYWDAGTEVDEAPGAGPNQAPRQTAANTGPVENGAIDLQDNGVSYPSISAVIQLTISQQLP